MIRGASYGKEIRSLDKKNISNEVVADELPLVSYAKVRPKYD